MAWAASAALFFVSGVAHAKDPACEGFHSVLRPLPDKCLEPIDTDRPHQTDTPHLVDAGHVVIESALAEVALGGTMTGSDPRTHVVFFDDEYRLGLFSRFNLELLFKHADYVPDLARFVSPGPMEVRAKVNLLEGGGVVPALTLTPTIFVPFASEQVLRGGGIVFLGWELPLGFELEVNLGVLFQAPPSPAAVLVMAAALTNQLFGPLKTFIDVYATGYNVQLGTGLLLPLGRDVQLDAGTYVGLNGEVFGYTPFLGLSVRR